ncbi:hypothetical protein ACFP3I_06870 [Chryseobacterium arachidis]
MAWLLSLTILVAKADPVPTNTRTTGKMNFFIIKRICIDAYSW